MLFGRLGNGSSILSRILLHLAARVPAVYEQATENAVMEVRRAR